MAAGFGYRRHATARALCEALEQALAPWQATAVDISAIGVPASRCERAAVHSLARWLGATVVWLPLELLRAQVVWSRSAHSLRETGLPCVSEACALAATGASYPKARLLAARTVTPDATCALATRGGLR